MDVTIVDRTNHHLFQPLLYQVAAGIISPGLIAPAIRGTIKKQRNAGRCWPRSRTWTWTTRWCRALGPDGRAARPGVRLAGRRRRRLALVLRQGRVRRVRAGHEDHRGRPLHARRHPVQVRDGRDGHRSGRAGRVADLRRHRRRAHRRRAGRPARRTRPPGAAAGVPDGGHHRGPDHPARGRARRCCRRSRRSCSATPRSSWRRWGWRSASTPWPPTWTTSRSRSRARTGSRRSAPGPGSGRPGVQASPLAKMLAEKTGAETDRAGRVSVNPDCSLPGHPEVFAVGDMVSLNELPGVAQPAMQEGKYVAKLIKARTTGAPTPPPFKYFDKGNMATIGHKAAVADAFGVKVHRFHRLPDVGLHPRRVPGRLGQPARHPVQLGPVALVHQEPRPPHHHVLPVEEGPQQRRGSTRAACARSAGVDPPGRNKDSPAARPRHRPCWPAARVPST